MNFLINLNKCRLVCLQILSHIGLISIESISFNPCHVVMLDQLSRRYLAGVQVLATWQSIAVTDMSQKMKSNIHINIIFIFFRVDSCPNHERTRSNWYHRAYKGPCQCRPYYCDHSLKLRPFCGRVSFQFFCTN